MIYNFYLSIDLRKTDQALNKIHLFNILKKGENF